MTELLRIVNNNTGVFTIALTGAMVILTALYVHYTKRILLSNHQTLEELKEQTWSANRAYVNLRLPFRDRSLCMLELSNDGKTPARNVRLKLDRDIFLMGDLKHRINDLPLFSETFETIPSGSKHYLCLWAGTEKPGTELVPNEFKVTATYEALGRSVCEVATLHLHMFEGTDFPTATAEESLEKVPRILDEIRKTLDKILWRLDQAFRKLE